MSPLLGISYWWGCLIEDKDSKGKATTEVDLFPLIDYEQFLHWYFHYTGYHVQSIIIHYALFRFALEIKRLYYALNRTSKFNNIVIVTEVLFYFSIFRLVEYWAFRGQTPLLGLCTALFLITLTISVKWLRNS